MLGKRLSRDRIGGIEGLPLQLMVIILVATMGTVVIVGWMSSIDSPQYIGSVTVDPDTISYGDGTDMGFSVTVTDQDGNGLSGAVVTLSGCGIRNADGSPAIAQTDRHGVATFTDLVINKITSVKQIDVDVVKQDHGSKRTQILVIP